MLAVAAQEVREIYQLRRCLMLCASWLTYFSAGKFVKKLDTPTNRHIGWTEEQWRCVWSLIIGFDQGLAAHQKQKNA